MKKITLILSSILLLTVASNAQRNKPILVSAGTNVRDYFPFQEMYRYPAFIEGKVFFKNGATNTSKFNYNLLSAEMDYAQLADTLSIANPTDIKFITIDVDTFYFDKGYVELIYGGRVKVALKQYFQLKETQKRDSYGSAGSNSATDSYSSLQSAGQNYKLILNQDRIFQKVSEFYLAIPSSGFVPFTKKKVLKLFPQSKIAIENYLKSTKVAFDSREDLIRFAGYLNGLGTQ